MWCRTAAGAACAPHAYLKCSRSCCLHLLLTAARLQASFAGDFSNNFGNCQQFLADSLSNGPFCAAMTSPSIPEALHILRTRANASSATLRALRQQALAQLSQQQQHAPSGHTPSGEAFLSCKEPCRHRLGSASLSLVGSAGVAGGG